MAALTTDQKAVIQTALDLLDGNYEKPFDEKTAHLLSTIHAALGYDSQIKILEDIRDKPHSVLLNALLFTNS